MQCSIEAGMSHVVIDNEREATKLKIVRRHTPFRVHPRQ